MKTIYANVVNIRVTPTELVFEFGTHFPDAPAQKSPPDGWEPELRVALASKFVDGIAQMLAKVVEHKAAAAKAKADSVEKKESKH